jgi:hypothetical protein
MSDSVTPIEPVCGICGEAIHQRDETVVTATSVIHVACIETSAAAA